VSKGKPTRRSLSADDRKLFALIVLAIYTVLGAAVAMIAYRLRTPAAAVTGAT
jgi:hypothetical protein